MPKSPWIMAQSWHDLLFAHWPVPAHEMRALIPPQLELDTFDGDAWVGVVPFRMSGIRPRACPAVPWLSAFLELNVRTYVRSKDPENPKPGVYFFSLDAANPVAVAVARSSFKLPYFNAAMRMSETENVISYRSQRTHRGAGAANFEGRYGPLGEVYRSEPGSLEHWLTERYSLYTVSKGRAFCGEIHHGPWPLQSAFCEIKGNTIAAAANICLPDTAPLLHFARSIDVVVWPISAVKTVAL